MFLNWKKNPNIICFAFIINQRILIITKNCYTYDVWCCMSIRWLLLTLSIILEKPEYDGEFPEDVVLMSFFMCEYFRLSRVILCM